ncbi:hypothetical protein AMECASPLE_027845 [Ameca splendens]|uniref:Uncharacterized protein n=1 Tax=Ameca splendens TaxID=208324 RepID=A0ABV1A0U3_9TELE
MVNNSFMVNNKAKDLKQHIVRVTKGIYVLYIFSYNDVFTCKALTTKGLRTIRLRDPLFNRDGTDCKELKRGQLSHRNQRWLRHDKISVARINQSKQTPD